MLGEVEFSLEAKTALEEITVNTALILKVVINRHFLSSYFLLYSFVSFYLGDQTQFRIIVSRMRWMMFSIFR